MSLSKQEVSLLTVDEDGEEVEVEVHPLTGPILLTGRGEPGNRPDAHGEGHGLGGSHACPDLRGEIFGGGRPRLGAGMAKDWTLFSSTEKEIAIRIAAKKNKARLALKQSGAKQMEAIERNTANMMKIAAAFRSADPYRQF